MKSLSVFCTLFILLFITSVSAQTTWIPGRDPLLINQHNQHKAQRSSQELLISSTNYGVFNGQPLSYDSGVYVYGNPSLVFTPRGAYAWTEFDNRNWNTVTGTFFNMSRYTQTYDAQGNALSEVLENYDTVVNVYRNALQWIYTYDGNNNVLTATGQMWNNVTNAWEDQNKRINNYNAAHQLIQTINQNWSSVDMGWRNSSQYILSLNAAGGDTLQILQNWDTASQSWSNASEYISTYNATGDKTQRLTFLWNGSAWDTTPLLRIDMAYDADHHETFQVNLNWNTSTLAWDSAYRFTWTYNTYGDEDVSTQHTWLSNGEADQVHRAHYSLLPTGILEEHADYALLYPNPVTDHLFISIPSAAEVKIYNALGDLMTTVIAVDQLADINTSAMPSGIYFALLQYADGSATTRKFTKD